MGVACAVFGVLVGVLSVLVSLLRASGEVDHRDLELLGVVCREGVEMRYDSVPVIIGEHRNDLRARDDSGRGAISCRDSVIGQELD